MFKNYFKIAWRNFLKNKSFSLINTIGLSIALSTFFVISLFIYDEWSYDRYHEDSDQLYRVYQTFNKDSINTEMLYTPFVLRPILLNEVPNIEEAFRINSIFTENIVEASGNRFIEKDLYAVDPSIFEVFSYSIKSGDPSTFLNEPFTVVITESVGKKYFGEETALGKTISIETWDVHDYEVTGVVKDLPANTHFHFDILTSNETYIQIRPNFEDRTTSWNHNGSITYLKLNENSSLKEIEASFDDIISKNRGEWAQYFSMKLQPVTDIHLTSNFEQELEANSDKRYLYIFGSVALLILVVACINYINLSTATSTDRAMEVGVRKTFGVVQFQIVFQFLIEAFIICLSGVLLAVLSTELILPYFNNIVDKKLLLPYSSIRFWGLTLGFSILISFIAGIYPSIYLSRIKPIKIVTHQTSGKNKSLLRNGLIIFQFTAAVILIVSTIVIKDQLGFIQNKKLGFESEKVLLIDSEGLESSSAFKDELLKISSVNNVTSSNQKLPAGQESRSFIYPTGSPSTYTNLIMGGRNFTETLDLELLAGNDLDKYFTPNELDYLPILINEALVKKYGWEENPLGKTFEGFEPQPKVVGVLADFHYKSAKQEIEPLILRPGSSTRNTYINIETKDIRRTLDEIEKAWKKVGPQTPFIYSFIDDEYQAKFNAEEKLASIFSFFTILAILISCVGLFGLTAFTAERKTKEIGIRKVLGAGIQDILKLLSKDFLLLILAGFIIAVPITWYLMNKWLADYAYRIEISSTVFLISGGLILVITLVTISWQSIKAALTNPVDSLKTE